MNGYMYHFDGHRFQQIEPEHGPVIVGDLLAVWQFPGNDKSKYLIDGMESGMTPVGTFEKEVGAVTFRDGMLLIATKEYVERANQAQ